MPIHIWFLESELRNPRGRAAVRLVQMRLRRVKWAVRGMRFKLWRALSDTSVHLLLLAQFSCQRNSKFREIYTVFGAVATTNFFSVKGTFDKEWRVFNIWKPVALTIMWSSDFWWWVTTKYSVKPSLHNFAKSRWQLNVSVCQFHFPPVIVSHQTWCSTALNCLNLTVKGLHPARRRQKKVRNLASKAAVLPTWYLWLDCEWV